MSVLVPGGLARKLDVAYPVSNHPFRNLYPWSSHLFAEDGMVARDGSNIVSSVIDTAAGTPWEIPAGRSGPTWSPDFHWYGRDNGRNSIAPAIYFDQTNGSSPGSNAGSAGNTVLQNVWAAGMSPPFTMVFLYRYERRASSSTVFNSYPTINFNNNDGIYQLIEENNTDHRVIVRSWAAGRQVIGDPWGLVGSNDCGTHCQVWYVPPAGQEGWFNWNGRESTISAKPDQEFLYPIIAASQNLRYPGEFGLSAWAIGPGEMPANIVTEMMDIAEAHYSIDRFT